MDFRGSGKEVRGKGGEGEGREASVGLPAAMAPAVLVSVPGAGCISCSFFFFPVLILMVLNGKKQILLGGQMNSIMLHSNPWVNQRAFSLFIGSLYSLQHTLIQIIVFDYHSQAVKQIL